MYGRGRNILPMTGFIMLTILLLGGFALAKNTRARKLLDEYKTTTSKQNQDNNPMFDFIRKGVMLDKYTVDESAELSADGIDKITITSVCSDLNIYYGGTNKIDVKYYGSVQSDEKEKTPYLEVDKWGREAIIRIKYPAWNNISYYEQTTLDVIIPDNLTCDLDLRNTSGSISAEELKGGNISISTVSGAISPMRISGEVIELKSTSGSVTVGKINASGKFSFNAISGKCIIGSIDCKEADLKSTSGEINFSDVSSDEIFAKSISGNIDLVLKRGNADIETSSGKIKAKFADRFDKLKIKSISGKVTLSIPESSQFDAEIHTVSGKISCSDFSMQISSSGMNILKATVGNGDSRVDINTASGDVEIIKN
ncbi:MAG: DUF4097 domain-containing protein [Clostridiaceae bacterium]|jgi:hypothetical protein|nr:DUF4097 domain-containing protein [Clostridiaceae bacterium]